jgi:hypothetical protein
MISVRMIFLLIVCLVFANQLSAQNYLHKTKSDSGVSSVYSSDEDSIIIDSDMNFEQALSGINIPESVKKQLKLITVYYYGFDSKLHQGQLVVNKLAAKDLIEIFDLILELKFPVEKVIPISMYNWSDEAAMKDNNTSCFNYRFVSGTRILSKHAAGLAIDINPLLNPYVKDGETSPQNSNYDENVPGTISSNSQITLEFKIRGWTWGGDWKSLKDYQHFQKNLK